MTQLTSSRPSASAPGENDPPAARMPTKAEPHAVTAVNPATRAATSARTATVVVVADSSRTFMPLERAEGRRL